MKHKIKSLLWLTFALVWISILGGIFAISMGWIGYLPPIEQLQNPIDKYASQVLAADGEVIGSYAHGGSNRVLVDYKDLSPNLVKALIATEDVRFEGTRVLTSVRSPVPSSRRVSCSRRAQGW